MISSNRDADSLPADNCLSGGDEREARLRALFPGDSEMAGRMRSLDWAATALGPPDQWAEPLKHSVKLCLTSRFPIAMYWGPEHTMLYNDPYIPLLGGTKHPHYLGRAGQEAWSDIWDTIGPMFESVVRTGEATWSQDFLLFIARNLAREEVYFTFTVGPILLESGTVAGFFCPCTEVTEKVVGARRLETLRKLGVQALETRTMDAVCEEAAKVLAENPNDIPFGAIYLVNDAGTHAVLKSLVGFSQDAHPFPSAVSCAEGDLSPWPLASVLQARLAEETSDLIEAGLQLPGGPWPEPSSKAIVLPIFAALHDSLFGLVVLGVGPRRVLDGAYRTFFELIASYIGTAISDAKVYEVQRQRAEEALRQSEERFRRCFELGLVGMAITSPTKGILEVNDEICKILGYERGELLRMTWAELTYPDDLAVDVVQFNRVMAGEIDGYSMDKRWIRKDGQVIDATISVKCLRRTDGSVDYFVALLQDVTERKRAEGAMRRAHEESEQRVMERTSQLSAMNEELIKEITERERVEEQLRRSEAYLAEGQRISHTGSWAVKLPSEDVFWSQEVYRIYGLDPATTKLSQQMAFQLIHPEDRPFVKEAFESALREKSDYAVEHRAILPDGSIKYLHTLGHPVLNESGTLTEYVGTVMEITERKRAEEALHEARAALAHVTRVMTMGELIACIAHEVNQPLGAIVTNGQACLRLLARESPDLHKLREVIERMISNGMRASEVITRMRALLKKNDAEKALLNVSEIIQEVIALTSTELIMSEIRLQTALAADLPPVLGDRVQLQQVILNLLLNAKEAMSGVGWKPRELFITSLATTSGEAVVAVRDSGIGLDPRDCDRICDAFFTTKAEGLGLGLSISRTIIEAHGGRLWATSNEDQGATVQFTLPASGERRG